MTFTATTAIRNSPSRSFIVLVCFFLACYGVAALGAISTASSIPTWYTVLDKPGFNPPNWIFAPVWTTLYGFMAIAAWLVWWTPDSGSEAGLRQSGLVFFAIQLFLNALWAPVFFYSIKYCSRS